MCQEEVGLASRNKVLKVVLIHVVSVPTLFNNKFILIQLAPTGYVTVVVSGSSLNSEELKRRNNWKVRHIGDEFDIFLFPLFQSQQLIFLSKGLMPSPYACAQPCHLGKYQATIDSCFGLLQPHQHGIGNTCQGELFQTFQIISRNY